MTAIVRKTVNVASTRSAGPDTRTFTISTRDEDREGDILDVEGVVLDAYRKNPVVLWAHKYDTLPVGRSRRIDIRGDRLEADVQFAPTEFAQEIKTLVDAGYIRAASVGFLPLQSEPLKRGRRFTKWELLEWSLVPVPSNPEALLVAAKAKGLKVPALSKALSSRPSMIKLPATLGGGIISVDSLERQIREVVHDAIEPLMVHGLRRR